MRHCGDPNRIATSLEGSQRRSGQCHRLRNPLSFRLVLERRAAHKKVAGNGELALAKQWHARVSMLPACSAATKQAAEPLGSREAERNFRPGDTSGLRTSMASVARMVWRDVPVMGLI
jgi:hypothetical protein